MQKERAIGDSRGRPGVELRPAVRSHQESAHRWAVHSAVCHTLQPVVVPAEALRMEVKDSIGTEIHFPRLGLTGIRRAVNPWPNDEALGAPGLLTPGVCLKPLE